MGVSSKLMPAVSSGQNTVGGVFFCRCICFFCGCFARVRVRESRQRLQHYAIPFGLAVGPTRGAPSCRCHRGCLRFFCKQCTAITHTCTYTQRLVRVCVYVCVCLCLCETLGVTGIPLNLFFFLYRWGQQGVHGSAANEDSCGEADWDANLCICFLQCDGL